MLTKKGSKIVLLVFMVTKINVLLYIDETLYGNK